MESLRGEFRKLSRATTTKELIGRFVPVAAGVFPHAQIDLLFRDGREAPWQVVHQGGPEGAGRFLPAPHDDTPSSCCVEKTPRRLCAVQRLGDGSESGVVLTRHPGVSAFTDVDVGSLRVFLQLLDNAYQSLLQRRKEKDLAFELNHRILQLTSLIDTGIEVSKLQQPTSLYQLALERAASLTNASRGLVRVTGKPGVREEIFFPAGERTGRTKDPDHCLTSAFRFGGKTYTFRLFDKESRHGVLPFEATDKLLLDALARQVHASLENRHLHQQELEKQRYEKEISLAASIQQRILPATLPLIDGYDLAGINIPSKSVGGDYFDCIPLPDGRYAIVMADVAGKGIPAALLVSSLHAYLSAYLETPMSLAELAGRLNKVICRTSTPEKFITAFIALLTPGTGHMEMVNAGHNPAYWLRKDGTVHELKAGGIPFGMLDMDLSYESEGIDVARGERVLLYTDGIPEATSAQNLLYESVTPLRQFLMAHKSDRADGFIRDLIDDIKRFTGDAPQSDDITALYIIRL